ncbi:class I SAM-dependent methyltransferase [Alkalihalobacillus sp. CinArs1]|uniref:class I SAM-dependent methyltransferase n=1 Tax=Alkalihalobacillus sp. CinArs1 TaxID=2995314 RepID=UPI0022DE5730|nr:class I SAM-dependent methyltransferase [Alkalihalobacillus sp. CinArs1]
MLSKQGFDLWANEYDHSVQVSEESDSYPFAGYKEILNAIYNEVMSTEKANILDIGFGTGVLASRLYEAGHDINGIDFSNEMIRIAQLKMPYAQLIEWDLTHGLPEHFKKKQYDVIISTYALHHISDREKVAFIKELLPQLSENGKILIGDVAFENRRKLEACRSENLHHWDDDEFYFAFDELKAELEGSCKLEFHDFSHCGGVIQISN